MPGESGLELGGKTVFVYGDASKIFSFIVSLIRNNPDNSLLFLDDFHTRAMLKELGLFESDKLSRILLSKFESLVELERVLERFETTLIHEEKKFGLLILGSLPDTYLVEISLHEPSSHSDILYLLNKVLAFFSYLSKRYGCTGILLGPRRSVKGAFSIPAERIFLYWVDYVLELRGCEKGGVIGELVSKNGRRALCVERILRNLSLRECDKDACPRSV
ncbi:MAG: hypothetical protein ACUVQ0_00555 [Thermoproteota archaeon]